MGGVTIIITTSTEIITNKLMITINRDTAAPRERYLLRSTERVETCLASVLIGGHPGEHGMILVKIINMGIIILKKDYM